jgi:hypothetical protein
MENESIENTKENEDFISDEKKQNQPTNPDEPAKQEYSCLTGGIIALLSFFGPWVSCSGETASGAKLGNEFWLVFSAAALIILTFILFVFVIKDKSRYFIYAQISYIVLSAFGICYLLYKYFKIKDGDFASMIEIKWGAYLTFIGFIITFISALMLKKEKQGKF